MQELTQILREAKGLIPVFLALVILWEDKRLLDQRIQRERRAAAKRRRQAK